MEIPSDDVLDSDLTQAREAVRRRISREISDSETEYVNRLTVLKEVYLDTFSGVISASDYATLFSGIGGITNISRTLAEDLKSNISDVKIGDSFLRVLPFFRMYETYSSKYTRVHDRIRVLRDTHTRFIDTLEKVEADPRIEESFDLSTYLQLPLKRVSQYKRDLQKLLRVTEDGDPDRKALVKAIAGLKGVAKATESVIRKINGESTILVSSVDSSIEEFREKFVEFLCGESESSDDMEAFPFRLQLANGRICVFEMVAFEDLIHQLGAANKSKMEGIAGVIMLTDLENGLDEECERALRKIAILRTSTARNRAFRFHVPIHLGLFWEKTTVSPDELYRPFIEQTPFASFLPLRIPTNVEDEERQAILQRLGTRILTMEYWSSLVHQELFLEDLGTTIVVGASGQGIGRRSLIRFLARRELADGVFVRMIRESEEIPGREVSETSRMHFEINEEVTAHQFGQAKDSSSPWIEKFPNPEDVRKILFPSSHWRTQLVSDGVPWIERIAQVARIAILLYDVTRKATLAEAIEWGEKLRVRNPFCKVILVGNKCDLVSNSESREEEEGEMVDPSRDGQVAAVERGWHRAAVSCMTGEGLHELRARVVGMSQRVGEGIGSHPFYLVYDQAIDGRIRDQVTQLLACLEPPLDNPSSLPPMPGLISMIQGMEKTIQDMKESPGFIPFEEYRHRLQDFISACPFYDESSTGVMMSNELKKKMRFVQEGRVLGILDFDPELEESFYYGKRETPIPVLILGELPEADAKNGQVVVFRNEKRSRGILRAVDRWVLAFKGTFKNGAAEGEGTEFQKNGKTPAYQGSYLAGHRSGPGVEFAPSGKRRFRGVYARGRRHGRGQEFAKDGTTATLTGEWRNGALFRIDADHVRIPELDFNKIRKQCTVKNRIGVGGTSSVVLFKVQFPPRRGKPYCLKVIQVSSDTLERELTRALRVVASLRHPNLIAIHSYSKDPLAYLMTLGVCSVADLITKADKRQEFGIELNLPSKLKLLFEASSGMAYLHANSVMHRDMKWANCILDETMVVRLCDIDFAKLDEEAWRVSARNETNCGTELFVCPEITNAEPYTRSCDVYSFGMMIYTLMHQNLHPYAQVTHCTICNVPISTFNFTHHVANCQLRPPEQLQGEDEIQFPQWLKDLCHACWAHDPKLRPAASDVVDIITRHYITAHHREEAVCCSPDSGVLAIRVRCGSGTSRSSNETVLILRQKTLECLREQLESQFVLGDGRKIKITASSINTELEDLVSDAQLTEESVVVLPSDSKSRALLARTGLTHTMGAQRDHALMKWELMTVKKVKEQMAQRIEDLEDRNLWLAQELEETRARLKRQKETCADLMRELEGQG